MISWFKKLPLWKKALVVSVSPMALLLALGMAGAILEKAGVIDLPESAAPLVAKEGPGKGWTPGYLDGFGAARSGKKKPDSATVDAAARRSATQLEVSENERSFFVYNYKDGFWIGWGKGN